MKIIIISLITVLIYSTIINRPSTYDAYGVFQSELNKSENFYTFNFKKDNKLSIIININTDGIEKNINTDRIEEKIQGEYKYLSNKTYLITTTENTFLITIQNGKFFYVNDENQVIELNKRLDVPFIE